MSDTDIVKRVRHWLDSGKERDIDMRDLRRVCHLAETSLKSEMPRWIPAGERLPDDDITVMVAVKDADEPVWLGYHDEHGWTSATDGVPLYGLVTHWQPMLTPPR